MHALSTFSGCASCDKRVTFRSTVSSFIRFSMASGFFLFRNRTSVIIAIVHLPDMRRFKQTLVGASFFILSVALASDVAGEVLESVLRVTVIARGDPATPAEMYWALTALPTDKDILASDPAVRGALSKALKVLAEENIPEWNLKFRGNFKAELRSKIAENYAFTLQSVPPPDVSSDRGPRTIELKAQYEVGIVIPAPVRKRLKVQIVVSGSREISANPVATTLGTLASHGVAGLAGLTDEEKAIQVWVADGKTQGSGSAWRDSIEHRHAYDVSASAFAIAKKNALQEATPNEGGKSGAVVREIMNALRNFQLSSTWETVTRDEAKDLVLFPGGNTWVIKIPLHAVGKVAFEFSAIQTEGQEFSWESYPYADQLTTKKSRAEIEIEKGAEAQFSGLRGRLLTVDELHSQTKPILAILERSRNVLHAAGPGSRDYDLVFSGVWLPRETELIAGVGYSTDKGFGGKVGLTSRNLPPVKNSLLTLNIAAGLEKQDGNLSYTLPDYYKSADGRLFAQLDLTGNYKRDDDQKLGAPDKAGLREEQVTGALKNVLHFVTNPVPTSGAAANLVANWGYGAILETTVGYSEEQLSATSDGEVQDGSELFALANLQQNAWRDLRKPEAPGIGRIEAFWQLRGKKGFNAGLGDFDFFAGDTTAALTVYFGRESSRDFFVRVLAGGAVSSSNTPVFEQFRLGGDAIVRGLEEGERLARGVVFDSVEGGVRAGRLWQWISRSSEVAPVSPGKAEANNPTPSAGGFDLGNSYVSLFFDHAYITRPSSRSGADLLSRDLESVGAAVEIPLPASAVRGRLRLGYAWSPQSIHEVGRSFVSVAIDFP
jgi:hypothetical protein